MYKCPNCNSETSERKQRNGFLKFIPVIKKRLCNSCPTRFSKFAITKNSYITLKNF